MVYTTPLFSDAHVDNRSHSELLVSAGICTGKGPGPCGTGAFTGAISGVIRGILGRWRFGDCGNGQLNGDGLLGLDRRNLARASLVQRRERAVWLEHRGTSSAVPTSAVRAHLYSTIYIIKTTSRHTWDDISQLQTKQNQVNSYFFTHASSRMDFAGISSRTSFARLKL